MCNQVGNVSRWSALHIAARAHHVYVQRRRIVSVVPHCGFCAAVCAPSANLWHSRGQHLALHFVLNVTNLRRACGAVDAHARCFYGCFAAADTRLLAHCAPLRNLRTDAFTVDHSSSVRYSSRLRCPSSARLARSLANLIAIVSAMRHCTRKRFRKH